MTMTISKSTEQLFGQWSLSLALSGIYSCLDGGSAFLKRIQQSTMFMVSVFHITGDVGSDHLRMMVSSQFLCFKLTVIPLVVNILGKIL